MLEVERCFMDAGCLTEEVLMGHRTTGCKECERKTADVTVVVYSSIKTIYMPYSRNVG